MDIAWQQQNQSDTLTADFFTLLLMLALLLSVGSSEKDCLRLFHKFHPPCCDVLSFMLLFGTLESLPDCSLVPIAEDACLVCQNIPP